MPDPLKTAIDNAISPTTMLVGWFSVLAAFYLGRRWFVRPAVAATLLLVSLVFLAASLRDPHFAAVALAPDNIAVMAMLYLLAFFTWLGASQAVGNDRRLRADQLPNEGKPAPFIFTWPDLVYSELICALLVMTLLLAWSLLVPAPLEQPANPSLTPNPSKAPWYFLGVQEMLFWTGAPWLGVAALSATVLALLALPYVDRKPAGNGYYTIAHRRLVYIVFQSIFWFWVLLLVIGVFLRGPNWDFLGPYQIRLP